MIYKCNGGVYLLKQLKILCPNTTGLRTVFCSNIRSGLSYNAAACFSVLFKTDKARLEKVQDTATGGILPDLDYNDRTDFLDLPLLCDFLMELSELHFNKIASFLVELILIIVDDLLVMRFTTGSKHRGECDRTFFPYFMPRFKEYIF